AMRALAGIHEPAAPYLRQALREEKSPEVRRRVEHLLAKIEPAESTLERRRALEVLEQIDTLEARQFLALLARGAPGAWLTREAEWACVRQLRRAAGTAGRGATAPSR